MPPPGAVRGCWPRPRRRGTDEARSTTVTEWPRREPLSLARSRPLGPPTGRSAGALRAGGRSACRKTGGWPRFRHGVQRSARRAASAPRRPAGRARRSLRGRHGPSQQQVGQRRVAGQDRPVEIGAEHPARPRPLGPVTTPVAHAPDHLGHRSCAGPDRGHRRCGSRTR